MDQTSIAQAREHYLSGSASDSRLGIREEIFVSWRRSLLYGLRPADVMPSHGTEIDEGNQLLRAAEPIVARRAMRMEDFGAALTLTDRVGRVLGRWVRDPTMTRLLDSRRTFPGRCIAEADIGTNSSGISLETGRPALVVGYEHFAAGATSLTTAGAPIRHPITRRVLGSLNLVCPVRQTHPLLLPWVGELAEAIEQQIIATASHAERRLFEAYLVSAQDARHPVVCVSEGLVIANASAARLLDANDQTLLWELAAQRLDAAPGRIGRFTLSTGNVVDVDCQPVADNYKSVGAIVRLTRVETEKPAGHSRVAGTATPPTFTALPGKSEPWTQFVTSFAQRWESGGHVLVCGEKGSGKFSVAIAITRGVSSSTLDIGSDPAKDWVTAMLETLATAPDVVLLRRADLLQPAQASAICRLLSTENSANVRVIATAITSSSAPTPDTFLDWPGAVVTAPPLRDRLEDVPDVLAAMTVRAQGTTQAARWSSEAVQVIQRIACAEDLHTLDAIVRGTCSGLRGAVVLPEHLPVQCLTQATRRTLLGLERVEAHALIAALRAADGNKREAAETLGIARSTLYRKMRALGLDLRRTTF